jgi:hypothetical protein
MMSMAGMTTTRTFPALLTAAVLIFSRPAPVVAEVHVELRTPSSESAVLSQIVRDELDRAHSAISALEARVTIGAAVLTSTEFEAILGSRARPQRVTAVFANPDPLDQLALARSILGGAKLGVFASPLSRSLVVPLTEHGVGPIQVSSVEDIDKLLRAAEEFDAVIVLPDPTVLNQSNINHVVRTLYQRRKVLIGYSATLTRVGSLASVFPTRQAVARSIRTTLEVYAFSGVLPAPGFVRDVDVALNERLARSLNIVLPKRAEVLADVCERARVPEAGR